MYACRVLTLCCLYTTFLSNLGVYKQNPLVRWTIQTERAKWKFHVGIFFSNSLIRNRTHWQEIEFWTNLFLVQQLFIQFSMFMENLFDSFLDPRPLFFRHFLRNLVPKPPDLVQVFLDRGQLIFVRLNRNDSISVNNEMFTSRRARSLQYLVAPPLPVITYNLCMTLPWKLSMSLCKNSFISLD